MDRDHLTRLIDDPAHVQRDDIVDLKAMADRYPWFSGAHLLLAVGGHREGDVLFDEQLKASAAHLPSRAVLFDRLHAPMSDAPAPISSPVAQGVLIVPEPETAPHEGSVRYTSLEEVPLVTQERTEAIRVEPPTPTLPQPSAPEAEQIPVETVATVIPEPRPLATEEMAPEPTMPTPPDPPLPEHIPTPWKERLLRGDRDEEDLDRQMRDSAVAISYELLLERESLLETPPADPAPPIAPESVAEVEQTVVVSKPIAVTSRSFTDWLSQDTTDARRGIPAVHKEHVPEIKLAREVQVHRAPGARPVVDPEIIRAVHQLGTVESKHEPETPETKALVDRFIQQNTEHGQQPKKAEFFNPQTAAKRSLEEHADLVTETLARIYEKQGNITKAIAAYERLAVKHPEKSAHFRSLAKALTGR